MWTKGWEQMVIKPADTTGVFTFMCCKWCYKHISTNRRHAGILSQSESQTQSIPEVGHRALIRCFTKFWNSFRQMVYVLQCLEERIIKTNNVRRDLEEAHWPGTALYCNFSPWRYRGMSISAGTTLPLVLFNNLKSLKTSVNLVIRGLA